MQAISNGLIIFCYCVVAYGACNVIVFGSGPFKFFEKLRRGAKNINEHFGQLFNCMMCLPANFGWVCSLVNKLWIPVAFTPFNIIFKENGVEWYNLVLLCLCDGAFTSGIVWLIHNIETFFENRGKIVEQQVEYITEDVINVDDITSN